MSFIPDALVVAHKAMGEINPAWQGTYVSLIEFLVAFPDMASNLRGRSAPAVGSASYIEHQAKAFADTRSPRAPKAPTTIPDEMVSVILHEYFDIDVTELGRVKREHLLSMGAENLVGDLLERYLASEMESRGWIWCSGAVVRAVDFVKPPVNGVSIWRMLQVKNRDNSENSSSKTVRDGTDIEKWHRTFSRRVGSNWLEFPDQSLRMVLSEGAFITFARNYLRALPK